MKPGFDLTIAQKVAECLRLFALTKRLGLQQKQRLQENEISEEALSDALARFMTWIESNGASQRGEASLDNRLRHADIHVEIMRLLEQLTHNLDDLMKILSYFREQQTWDFAPEMPSVDLLDILESDNDDDSDDAPTVDFEQAFPATTEISLLFKEVLEAISSLLRLSMFIRNSTREDKFAKLSKTQEFNPRHDILHIRDRYPLISRYPFLLERLGRANAQRRQWLTYKQRHREKLARPWYETVSRRPLSDSETQHDNPVSSLSPTQATTFDQRQERKTELAELEKSEKSFSETSYVEITHGESGQGAKSVPEPPPESIDESPFECPYCFSIIVVRGSRSWSKHVHSDLASYICTQDSCDHPAFESSHQWFNHELEQHRRQWLCDVCGSIHQSADSIKAHMTKSHSGNFLPSQLPALVTRCSRPLLHIPASACPFCDYEAAVKVNKDLATGLEPITVSAHAFQNHLGRHMEQLALLVLPEHHVIKRDDLDSLRSENSSEDTDQSAIPGPSDDCGSNVSDSLRRNHWVVRIFQRRPPLTAFRSRGTSGILPQDMSDAIDRMEEEDYKKLQEILFENGKLRVSFWQAPHFGRAKLLCDSRLPHSPGKIGAMGLAELKVRRAGSFLKFYTRDHFWVGLSFVGMEQLVLFYSTFLALRAEDDFYPVRIRDHEIRGENPVFEGVIDDGRYRHLMKILVDKETGCVRLQSSILEGLLERKPIWTAFITGALRSTSWLLRIDAKTIHLNELNRYIFAPDDEYEPQVSSEGKAKLVFATARVADAFQVAIDKLGRGKLNPEVTRGEPGVKEKGKTFG